MSNRKIYRRLTQESPPFSIPPADEAWKAMAEKLEEKKRRRLLFWWPVGAGILLVGAGLFGTWKMTRQHDTVVFVATRATGQPGTTPAGPVTQKDNGNRPTPASAQNAAASLSEARNPSLSTDEVTLQAAHDKSRKFRGKNSHRARTKQRDGARQGDRGLRDEVAPGQPAGLTSRDSTALSDTRATNSSENPETNSARKKTDSSPSVGETPAPEDKKEETAVHFAAGLQWSLPVPFAGLSTYFYGGDGRSMDYHILLPAAWGSVVTDRHQATLVLAPFAATPFGSKPYRTTQITGPAGTGQRNFTLHKAFGFNVTVEASVKLQGNWWLGGQVSGNFWRKGMETVEDRYPGLPETRQNQAVSDSTWRGFSTFQPGVGIHFLYREKGWQAGMRVNGYFVPIAGYPGQRNQFAAEGFFRWALWRSK